MWLRRLASDALRGTSLTKIVPAAEASHESPALGQTRLDSNVFVAESSILNLIPMAICIVDQTGIIQFQNTAFVSNVDVVVGSESILDAFESSERRTVEDMLFRARCGVSTGEVITRLKPNGSEVRRSKLTWTMAVSATMRHVVCTGSLTSESSGYERSLKESLLTEIKAENKAVIGDGSPREDEACDVMAAVQDMKSKFVRLISHEIRSPLSVINSGIAILSEQIDSMSAEMQDVVVSMETACKSLVGFLDDLLVYEKIESSTLSLKKSRFDIIGFIRRVVGQLISDAREREVDMELTVDAHLEVVVVEADMEKIEQVFRTMVSEALKSSAPQSRVSVILTTDEINNLVRVEVQDWGSRQMKERRASILREPFTFDPTELHAEKCAGLGYYISRGIVEMHSGVIGVKSDKEGTGLRVFVDLKIASQNLSYIGNNNVISKCIQNPREGSSPVDGLRVLIVDDVLTCRKLHRRLLSPFCSEIIEANDGREAVEMMRKFMKEDRRIDGLIMDNSMPNMNGTEAAWLIRGLGYRGKIFGVTGNAFLKDVKEFVSHGADEVLIKPLKSDLYEYVAREFSSWK